MTHSSPGVVDPYTRLANASPTPPVDPYTRHQASIQLDMFRPPEAPPPESYVILRDDSAMSIMPASDEVKKWLTLKFRTMEKRGWKMEPVNHEEPMYRVLERDGKEFLQTYQGLWRSLRGYLVKKGRKVQMVDLTLPYATPNLVRAWHGLTEPQKPMITAALLQNCSGLIGAPTRYGKTYLMAAICRAYNGLKIVVTAPGIDLCRQIEDDLRKILPDRDIRGIYTGSKHRTQGPDITVCSVDSLEKCDAGGTELLLIDEPHAMVADGRLPKIHRFFRARKFGFGATLDGRYDKKDRLIEALIGPILVNKTYLEAVAEGSIAPLKVVFVKVPFSKDAVPGRATRETTWKRLLTQSSKLAALARTLCEDCIPQGWQTMIFIKDEKQADYLFVEAMDPTCSVAMAKKLKDKARRIMTARIAANEIWRILASKIYIQGVTFPDLRVVMNFMSGGASTGAIQMPGRLLQKRPGKRYGAMVDILFECTDSDQEDRQNPAYNALIGECWARHKVYKKIGYDVTITDDLEVVKEIIANSYEKAA